MSLNIKDEKAHRLARQLSRLTGQSMTVVVRQALEEQLDRVRGKADESRVERWLAIGRDCAAHLKEPYKSMSIDELLYDENGLPK